MYWPACGAQLSGVWQLLLPLPSSVVADARTWLNAIGTQINGYFSSISSVVTVVLSVRSLKNHASYNVNQLQVGSVLDTQRRRRSALPETYSGTPYP
jgi:hypothetical protein